mgnify:CR=1 FL=1
MTQTKISSAVTTSMNDADPFMVPFAQQETYAEYTPAWLKWKGYYDNVPDLQNVIDKKALWAVGKGYTINDKKNNTVSRIEGLSGFGKDTFSTILMNNVKTFTICGDSFAEIIGGKSFTNLKPLDPSTIKIIGDDKGRLKNYEQ